MALSPVILNLLLTELMHYLEFIKLKIIAMRELSINVNFNQLAYLYYA